MIDQLDITVRLITAGAASLLLLLLIAGEVRSRIKVTLIGLLVGAVAYLFNSTPLTAPGTALDPWVDLVSIFTPFWIWLFARRLFEREPQTPVLWGVVAIFVGSWWLGNFVPASADFGFYIIHLVALILIGDLIRVAFSDRADDLIEKRRSIRLWFPLLVALQAGGILMFEIVVGAAIEVPLVQLANAILIFALTLFAGIAFLRTDPQLLAETSKVASHDLGEHVKLSPSESVLKEKLETLMAEGFYRTNGLTIAMLADRLGTPEHRLRALINARLGYRNFSAFLNFHRIGEAKLKLADPDAVDTPVLTMAMDLGYNSLPTFNRAFRAETGTTPTDFRREAIGQN